MSKQERADRKAARKRMDERLEAAKAQARAVVATGKCPDCGGELRSNLAITGWYQCAQYGAVGFRKDSSKPSCGFQCVAD